jgi:hypothetical protein
MRAWRAAGLLLTAGLLIASASTRAVPAPNLAVAEPAIDSLLKWRRAPFPLCADGTSDCEMFEVALVELLTRPEVWHGRRVAVSGYLHLEFEGNALYTSKDPRRVREALWFDTQGLDEALLRGVNDHEVRVVGTFDASAHGHLGLFAGTLTRVNWLRRH